MLLVSAGEVTALNRAQLNRGETAGPRGCAPRAGCGERDPKPRIYEPPSAAQSPARAAREPWLGLQGQCPIRGDTSGGAANGAGVQGVEKW